MKHYLHLFTSLPSVHELVLLQHQTLDLDKKVPHQLFFDCLTGSVLDSGIPGPGHYRTLPPGLQHFLLPLYNHTGTSVVSVEVLVPQKSWHWDNCLPALIFQGFQIFILFTARTRTFRATVSKSVQYVSSVNIPLHKTKYSFTNSWDTTTTCESYRDLKDEHTSTSKIP